MKEKLKTIAIIILLALSIVLIIGCKSKYKLFLPGHSIRSISMIEKDYEVFSDQDKQEQVELLK